MKNVTISMDEELVRLTRTEAAKAGKSMSRFISELVEKQLAEGAPEGEKRAQERLAALRRVFEGPKWEISENGRMPDAEERNARR